MLAAAIPATRTCGARIVNRMRMKIPDTISRIPFT
jgi:hypothetical protein